MSETINFESTQSSSDSSLAGMALQQVARDLALFAGCEVVLGEAQTQRSRQRPPVGEGVHISFRLQFEAHGDVRCGCLLMPLHDAIGVGALLAHRVPEEVAQLRVCAGLDDELKGLVIEVGCVVSSSLDNALRWFFAEGALVRAAGCQGVRSGSAPFFENPPEVEYIVAATEACIAEYEPNTWTLILPDVFESAD